MNMVIFDVVVLAIVGISCLLGAYRGFIKLSIDFVSVIISMIIAYFSYPLFDLLIAQYSQNEILNFILSVITAYMVSLIILSFLSKGLISNITVMSGGIVDRFLGFIFGLIRGMVICTIIFTSITIIISGSYESDKSVKEIITDSNNKKHPNWLDKAICVPYLKNTQNLLIMIIPEQLLNKVFVADDLPSVNDDSEL